VNVWSPDAGAARLPVLVWIYGGAYISGFSGNPMYDAGLIVRQGLVVVTFNHWVGAEGSAQLRGAPNNRGLLDQLAVLHWVRQNIVRFGGDPQRVTLCGQSAGAGSIATLLTMPLAAGLFQWAIAQSVPGLYCTPALTADIAATLAARLDAAPTDFPPTRWVPARARRTRAAQVPAGGPPGSSLGTSGFWLRTCCRAARRLAAAARGLAGRTR
jgi:para-nitrobenzyl esterase